MLIQCVYSDTIQVGVLVLCALVALYVLCNMSFKEHHHEDGHNRWPKHVGGYAVSNPINLHISIYSLVGFVSHNESSQHRHKSFKIIRCVHDVQF